MEPMMAIYQSVFLEILCALLEQPEGFPSSGTVLPLSAKFLGPALPPEQ